MLVHLGPDEVPQHSPPVHHPVMTRLWGKGAESAEVFMLE